MIKKLRFKFICITMTLVTLMLIVILGLVLFFTKRSLEQESIRMMHGASANSFFMGGPKKIPEPKGDIKKMRLPYFILRLNREGKLIGTSGDYYDLTDQDFLEKLMDTTLAMERETGIIKEYKLRFVHVITPDSQSLVFSDISGEITTMNNLLKDCIIIGIISFFCFLGISTLLAQWAIKPVDIAWKRQKQFIADASHELKTPLTVILTNAELLQTPGYDEDYKAKFSNNILHMSNQMKNLVEGLLELARVDNGITKSAMTTLNFSKLVEDSIYPFDPLYYENNLFLTSQIQDDNYVKGNEQYLHQVVEILLDNALKYAAPNTKVFVKLQKHEFHCILSVSNYGEKIASNDLKNIFERFYRIGQSGSSKNSYGLGLSIAKSIILDHNGKIWCESSKGKNTFYIQLRICN